jgi:predicted HAD superfamily Cof-like phosphohydrolase
MTTIREQVLAFHHAVGQPVLDKPQVPNDDRVRLRLRLITEEFFEMLEAALGTEPLVEEAKGKIAWAIEKCRPQVNLPEFVDALADLDYVCEGSRLEFGVYGPAIADEVQRSNLSKMGPDGKAIKRDDGKIVKGPNFSPPDIKRVLREQGWEG